MFLGLTQTAQTYAEAHLLSLVLASEMYTFGAAAIRLKALGIAANSPSVYRGGAPTGRGVPSAARSD